MIVVTGLIWDEWNRKHLAAHGILPSEVEEVCHSTYQVVESYRNRLLLIGETKRNRKLAVVLSPQDRNLVFYKKGVYYVITAFEKEES